MRRIILASLIILFTTSLAFATGTGTCTATKVTVTEINGLTRYSKVDFTWVSHTDGSVVGACSQTRVSGKLDSVQFIPDASTTQPSDAYDVVVLDAYGEDALRGLGANLSNTRTADTNNRTPLNQDSKNINFYNDTLTPGVTNAGSGKGGIIRMIFR
jgi:hypothetical protein